jgi:nucleoside-diphosphate-sugar epimerase
MAGYSTTQDDDERATAAATGRAADRAPVPVRTPPPGAHALVVGATGITGTALGEQLVAQGWRTSGISRRRPAVAGVEHVPADLFSGDPAALAEALEGLRPTHVFITAWARQDTEAENIRVNGAMVRDLLAALGEQGALRHVALVTGLKHYLGPFEAYAQGEVPDTPFLEDAGRLDVENFYYAQEDELFSAAARHGFTWSVHRSHTVIGFAVGNAMNMASTLGAYAAVVRAGDGEFVFPGSLAQWNGVVDLTDAAQLADHQLWAATTPAAADTAFNVVNGDVVRWRRLWSRLADALGVRAVAPGEEPAPLERQTVGAEAVWERIVAEHGLVEPDLSRVASWWHTDSDLGRPMEVIADMTNSRLAGFTGYVSTERALLATLQRYRDAKLLP